MANSFAKQIARPTPTNNRNDPITRLSEGSNQPNPMLRIPIKANQVNTSIPATAAVERMRVRRANRPSESNSRNVNRQKRFTGWEGQHRKKTANCDPIGSASARNIRRTKLRQRFLQFMLMLMPALTMITLRKWVSVAVSIAGRLSPDVE